MPPLQPRRTGAGGTGRGGISQARAYSPRGRTVRENGPATEPRDPAGQGRASAELPADGARPNLRLIAGGPGASSTAQPREVPPTRSRTSTGSGRGTTSRNSSSRGNTSRGTTDRSAGDRAAADRAAARAAANRGSGSPPRRGGPRRPAAAGQPGRPNPLAALPFLRRGPLPPARRFEASRRLRLGTAIMLLVFVTLGGRLVQLQLTDSRAYAAAGLADRLDHDRAAGLSRYRSSTATATCSPRASRPGTSSPTRRKSSTRRRPPRNSATCWPCRWRSCCRNSSRTPRRTGNRPSSNTSPAASMCRPANAVEALNLPGIGVRLDERREDPGHDLASNLVGFVGTDMNGLGGLESAYNSAAGRQGRLRHLRDR